MQHNVSNASKSNRLFLHNLVDYCDIRNNPNKIHSNNRTAEELPVELQEKKTRNEFFKTLINLFYFDQRISKGKRRWYRSLNLTPWLKTMLKVKVKKKNKKKWYTRSGRWIIQALADWFYRERNPLMHFYTKHFHFEIKSQFVGLRYLIQKWTFRNLTFVWLKRTPYVVHHRQWLAFSFQLVQFNGQVTDTKKRDTSQMILIKSVITVSEILLGFCLGSENVDYRKHSWTFSCNVRFHEEKCFYSLLYEHQSKSIINYWLSDEIPIQIISCKWNVKLLIHIRLFFHTGIVNYSDT